MVNVWNIKLGILSIVRVYTINYGSNFMRSFPMQSFSSSRIAIPLPPLLHLSPPTSHPLGSLVISTLSGLCTNVESHICPFWSDLFSVAHCPQGSPTLWHAPEFLQLCDCIHFRVVCTHSSASALLGCLCLVDAGNKAAISIALLGRVWCYTPLILALKGRPTCGSSRPARTT